MKIARATVGADDEMPLQGVVSVELKVPAHSIGNLVAEARRKGFRPIETATGDTLRALRASVSRVGLFKFEQGSTADNQRVSVIDSANAYMWVYYAQTTDKW